jgi:hypothetical protein
LEDGLRALQLKPLHDALRGLVDPALAEALAAWGALGALNDTRESPLNEADLALDGAGRSTELSSILETIRHRTGVLLAEVERYNSVGLVETGALTADGAFSNSPEIAQDAALKRVRAALRLGVLTREGVRWPHEAQAVLPVAGASHEERIRVWGTILAWSALESFGRLGNARCPEGPAAQLFDVLRLREPLAEAFARCGWDGEENWRAAARLRAAFAHSTHPASPHRWIHDPDVTWLIGMHQHEGVSYLVKEHFERLLWWMTLRDLCNCAADPRPDLEQLAAISDGVELILRSVAKGGYRVETLESVDEVFVTPSVREGPLSQR